MKRTLLAFSIATMALTTTADHLIVVKVGTRQPGAHSWRNFRSPWT